MEPNITYKKLLAYGFRRESHEDAVIYGNCGYHPFSMVMEFVPECLEISFHSSQFGKDDSVFLICDWPDGDIIYRVPSDTMLAILEVKEIFQLSAERFVLRLHSELARRGVEKHLRNELREGTEG